MCISSVSGRKDIDDLNDLRVANFAVYQSGKGCKAIAEKCKIHSSTVRKIIHKWNTFKTVAVLPRSGRPRDQSTQCSKTLQIHQELHLRFYRL